MDVCPVIMDFDYEAAFGKSSANGYERLLLDAMLGDQTLVLTPRRRRNQLGSVHARPRSMGGEEARGLSKLFCRIVGPGVC